MKVLVTGASGYVGTVLVRRLVAEGHEVTALDRVAPAACPDGVESVVTDILETDMSDLMSDADAVVHLAANPFVSDPNGRRDTYCTTKKLVDSAGCPKRVVFASSSAVYGEGGGVHSESDACCPASVYGRSKLDSEAILEDMDSVSLRFVNISGGFVRHGVVHDFYRKLRKDGRSLTILGDGTQTREYLHVDDAVEAMVHCLKTGVKGVYNVGNSDPISVNCVADVVAEAMGLDGVEFVHGTEKIGWEGDVNVIRLDSTRFRLTGWSPTYGSIDSIRDAVFSLESEDRDVRNGIRACF